MNRNEIGEFANRDWQQLSRFDHSYWAKEYRESGSAIVQKASRTLWQHMKQIRPEWPNAKERRDDLDHHIAFKQLLD